MEAGRAAEYQSRRKQQQLLSPKQKPGIKAGAWLPAEDGLLRDAVQKYGSRWVLVASEVGTRNGDQCAKRWNDNLNPELDHSPWTPDEEERLLSLVEVYGRNWKFMADHFLQARAPSALKNRYSLLKRRLQRKEAERGSSASQSPASPIDLASILGSSASASNFCQSAASFDTDILFRGDATTATSAGRRRREGGNPLSQTPTTTPMAAPPSTTITTSGTAWDDQDFWQNHDFLGEDMELCGTSFDIGINGEVDEADNKTAIIASGSSSSNPTAAVEYTVSCQRRTLRTLTSHLVEAAMEESAGWVTGTDSVTLTLQLRALT